MRLFSSVHTKSTVRIIHYISPNAANYFSGGHVSGGGFTFSKGAGNFCSAQLEWGVDVTYNPCSGGNPHSHREQGASRIVQLRQGSLHPISPCSGGNPRSRGEQEFADMDKTTKLCGAADNIANQILDTMALVV